MKHGFTAILAAAFSVLAATAACAEETSAPAPVPAAPVPAPATPSAPKKLTARDWLAFTTLRCRAAVYRDALDSVERMSRVSQDLPPDVISARDEAKVSLSQTEIELKAMIQRMELRLNEEEKKLFADERQADGRAEAARMQIKSAAMSVQVQEDLAGHGGDSTGVAAAQKGLAAAQARAAELDAAARQVRARLSPGLCSSASTPGQLSKVAEKIAASEQ